MCKLLTAEDPVLVSGSAFEQFGDRPPLFKNALELEHLALERCDLLRDDDEVGVVAVERARSRSVRIPLPRRN